MVEKIERQIIGLIAADRLDIPVSSMSGKLKRMKPKLAQEIEVDGDFEGERVYARVDEEDKMKARGMKEGISKFEEQFPRHGKILRGYIEEQRTLRETHMYFGVNTGCRLTSDDYMGVMSDLGFTEAQSKALYQPLMDASRVLSRKRDEERRILLDTRI